MTDIPSVQHSVPTRLGVTARYDDELVLTLTPRPETLHLGVVRASVLSFAIDAVAGIVVDDDPEMWTLTTDMSVRMRPVPAPERLSTSLTVLRRGARLSTCRVDLCTDEREVVATGALGFTRVPRRDTDPPKPDVSPQRAPEMFRELGTLSQPLRDEAGIVVVDAAEGVVEVEVSAGLRNSAGTLQGAMVALLAEVAAEELITARFGQPVVVTDIDLRYLAQAQVGPVRTKSRLIGTGPDAAVEIELIDTSRDRRTTLVYARAVPIPAP